MSNAEALAIATSYKAAVEAAATAASSGILPLLDSLEGSSFLQFTREIRPAILELSDAFADLGTQLSMAYYDEIRGTFTPTDAKDYKAQYLLNPLAHREMTRNEVAHTFNSLQGSKDYNVARSAVAAVVGDSVKKASFSNTVENIRKDKALIIITYMPSAKACRFCRSIIAQGRTNYKWVQGDSAYGGSGFMASVYRRGSQFHKRCACTPVPRFVSSQSESVYDTRGQEAFTKDFKVAAKQADKLGVPMNTPRQVLDVMNSYQASYREVAHQHLNAQRKIERWKTRERITDEDWKRIVGPKWGATDEDIYKMKQLLAQNNWKPFWLPRKEK